MPQVKVTRTCYTPGRMFEAGQTYDVTDEELEALKRAEVVAGDADPAEGEAKAEPPARKRGSH